MTPLENLARSSLPEVLIVLALHHMHVDLLLSPARHTEDTNIFVFQIVFKITNQFGHIHPDTEYGSSHS